MYYIANITNKIILNLIFIPFFWSFSYIVPKKKNLLVFGSYYGYKFTGNPKYFYLYLLRKKDSQYDPYWVTRNMAIYHELKKGLKPVAYLYSFSGIWKILRAEYLFIGEAAQDITGRTFLLGNFNIIESWHATPLKDISIRGKFNRTPYQKLFNFILYQELKLYEFVLSCSDSASKNLRSYFIKNDIQVLGYPRNDIFYDHRLSYRNYKNYLGLHRYHKTLLYAPTFRDHKNNVMPFSPKFLAKLNRYLKQNNYILLVKDHPISIFGRRLKNINLSHIRDVTDACDDIQELLIHADILITDYSGTIFEYCLINRPIIFYCYDYDDYLRNCRQMCYDYFREMPGPFARNEEALIPLIENAAQWFWQVTYKKRYNRLRDRFNKFQDGQSCERLYEYIKQGNFKNPAP